MPEITSMVLKALLEGFKRGDNLFTLEQQIRRHEPALADQVVFHRAAIVVGGACALLQRLGHPAGEMWLQPIVTTPTVGQPIWRHSSEVQWMRVEQGTLVSRGRAPCLPA